MTKKQTSIYGYCVKIKCDGFQLFADSLQRNEKLFMKKFAGNIKLKASIACQLLRERI
jgi:hypothetical protein